MPCSRVISLPALGQQIPFQRGQKIAGRFGVTAGQLANSPRSRPHFCQVGFVFGSDGCPGAHHIAKIVQHRARHDRVQVEDADPFPAVVVDHHVVELGIVMDDPFGQRAAGHQVNRQGNICLARQDKDRFPRGPAPPARRDRPARLPAAPPDVWGCGENRGWSRAGVRRGGC